MSNIEAVEILIHNVSHSDIVLSVNDLKNSLSINSALARPKFSHFKGITGLVSAKLQTISTPEIASHAMLPSGLPVPLGFKFQSDPIQIDSISNLRFRKDDHKLVSTVEGSDRCHIEAAYFPLLATLLPKWIELIKAEEPIARTKKIIFLITGRGTPMDSSARTVDNSTKYTGKLAMHFIQSQFPEIEVIHVHSTCNLFRYDENILFVKQDLLPMVDSIRDQLAERLRGKWKEKFHVSLSFADGASARVSAIQASLRSYKPSFFHFWQLKSFWTLLQLSQDDLEVHSFEDIATDSALRVSATHPSVQAMVREVRTFKEDFDRMSAQDNELNSFWLRKTGKAVLAVLMVQKPGCEPSFYRGINMEVSMPTGSLCAERNVIGTALAADLTLKREHLRMVAVYSHTSPSLLQRSLPSTPTLSRPPLLLPFPSTTVSTSLPTNSSPPSPLSPSRTHSQSSSGSIPRTRLLARKIRNSEPQLSQSFVRHSESFSGSGEVWTRLARERTRTLSTASDPDQFSPSPSLSSPFPSPSHPSLKKAKVDSSLSPPYLSPPSLSLPQDQEEEDWPSLNPFPSPSSSLPSFCPPCDPSNTETIYTVEGDMNPLKPCGACNEWLRKVSEVSPSFSVLTFTDADLRGVYIERVE